MKYYIVKDSIDEEIVGADYPQAYKFMKGYNPDAPTALFSLYKYWDAFPDYIPELDGIMLSGSAKLTDFVSDGFSSKLNIVSEKVKNVFEQYNLCPHRFYPLGLYKRKVKRDYYLLFLPIFYFDNVDFMKSIFVECNIISGVEYGDVLFNSKEELLQKKAEIKSVRGASCGVWGKTIVMNDQFDRELDLFVISSIDSSTYISERLKQAIEANGLTGWEFTPADHLVVE